MLVVSVLSVFAFIAASAGLIVLIIWTFSVVLGYSLYVELDLTSIL